MKALLVLLDASFPEVGDDISIMITPDILR